MSEQTERDSPIGSEYTFWIQFTTLRIQALYMSVAVIDFVLLDQKYSVLLTYANIPMLLILGASLLHLCAESIDPGGGAPDDGYDSALDKKLTAAKLVACANIFCQAIMLYVYWSSLIVFGRLE